MIPPELDKEFCKEVAELIIEKRTEREKLLNEMPEGKEKDMVQAMEDVMCIDEDKGLEVLGMLGKVFNEDEE